MIFCELDKEDLVNVRLASKQFDAISSRMLFQNVTIGLRYQSLANLEKIMQHPIYCKNARQITFNVSHYGYMAQDQSEYTQHIQDELQKELKTLVSQACHYHQKHMSRSASRLSVPTFYEPSCQNEASCNPEMILHLQSWISECRDLVSSPVRVLSPRWHHQGIAAILRGWQRYSELFEQQIEISTSGQHLQVLERALAHMPQIESLRIAALSYPPSRKSIIFDNGYRHIGFCLDRSVVFLEPGEFELFRLNQLIKLWNHGALRLKELIWKEQRLLWELIPVDSVFPLEEKPNLCHTTTLSVQVECDTRLRRPDRGTAFYNAASLYSVFEKMTVLQSLSLFGDDFRTVSFLEDIVPGQILDNLQSLSIRNMTLLGHDLIRLFYDRSHTLVTLTLDNVYLDTGTWERLTGHIDRIFDHLQGLYIGNIFDTSTGSIGFTRTELETMASTALNGRPNTLGWMYSKHKPGALAGN